jgi:hypothetical protein
MLDWRQEAPSISGELSREFFKSRTPPNVARLWLAHHLPHLTQGHASGLTRSMGRPNVAATEIYLATFRIDQLVAQVLVTPPQQVSPVRTRHGDAVRQVWPLTYEPLVWPPARTLDDFEYIAFCEAFLRDYVRNGLTGL